MPIIVKIRPQLGNLELGRFLGRNKFYWAIFGSSGPEFGHLAEVPSSGNTDLYPVGPWVVCTRLSGAWLRWRGKSRRRRSRGYMQLYFMERCGFNQFCWAKKKAWSMAMAPSILEWR